MTPRFDPTRAVIFDLARGQLRDDEGAARLNLPVALVIRLCEAAGDNGMRDFARGLGADLGRRIHDRLGRDGQLASVASWAEHLGGHLALIGLGNLRVERWGRALVLRVQDLPLGAEALVGGVLEGALSRGLSKDGELVDFRTEAVVAYLVVSPATAMRARQLRDSGQGLGTVIESLHQGAVS